MPAPPRCPKCDACETTTSTVDERKMYRCGSCHRQWYSNRITTGAYFCVVDEIADAVSEQGRFEIHSALLINGPWPRDEFHALAGAWCDSHNITMSLIDRREGKEVNQYAVFVRRR